MFAAALPPPLPPAAAAVVSPPGVAQPPPAAASSDTEDLPTQQVTSHGYHYTVVGNRLLPPAEVAAALSGATTPRDAVGALKQAYENRGYFLVALVGTQHEKEVSVRVIQGRITHIEGPKKLTRFFEDLKDDDELRKNDVIRPSILAEAYAATNTKQPQVSFQPAPEPGGSIMQISESPLANSHQLGASVTFGNYGNRYAARYLAQTQVSARQDGMSVQLGYARALPGLDPATHGAFYTGTTAAFSAITPIGIFGLDGSRTAYQLGEKFAPLYPAGRIKVFGGTATQLLQADPLRRWSLSEGVHRIHDMTTVFSGSYVLSDRRFTVVDLGSNFSWRFGGLFNRTAALDAAVGIKLGYGLDGFTAAPGAPASHFNIYTANVDTTQSLPGDYSLKLSLAGQATPDTLPSYEQWVLGGLNNLSAWVPGTITGDRGYLGRLVGQGPEWHAGAVRLRPSAFVEHGASRFSYIAPQAPVWQSLTDVGVSLNMDLPVAHTSGILAFAKPIGWNNVSQSLRDSQRAHVFFYLQAAF